MKVQNISLDINDVEMQDEWFGYLYKCVKCEEVWIWQDFKYCPNCGVTVCWTGEWQHEK
jgi:rRNA maturation endonuclease Nob1